MPHCIIEHSSNVIDTPDWNQVFSKLHKILVDTGEWIESDIKSRVIEHKVFYIGDGNIDNAFVTLNLQILDGRKDKLKKEISQKALNLLKKNFPKTIEKLIVSITVQISDIQRSSYCRYVNYQS